MKAPVRLGVIGCGRLTERLYLPAFKSLSGGRVVAVADCSKERRDLIASQIRGCRAFESTEALLDQAQADGVIVATPTETHMALARLALRRGLAVLIEKPLGRSLDEVNEMEALAASSGSLVMMGFNRRHWEPVKRLRQILTDEREATDVTAKLVMMSNPRFWPPIANDSDALGDLGSHQLDLVRYLFARDIITISARWTQPQTIRMRLVLTGGIVAECVAAHTDKSRESITVNCNGKKYVIRRGSERILPPDGRWRAFLDGVDLWSRRLRWQRSSLRRTYERQFECFVKAILSKCGPEPGLSDGIAALRADQAARQSAANNGAEVTI